MLNFVVKLVCESVGEQALPTADLAADIAMHAATSLLCLQVVTHAREQLCCLQRELLEVAPSAMHALWVAAGSGRLHGSSGGVGGALPFAPAPQQLAAAGYLTKGIPAGSVLVKAAAGSRIATVAFGRCTHLNNACTK